jgi:hypothetical protein
MINVCAQESLKLCGDLEFPLHSKGGDGIKPIEEGKVV